MLQDLCKKIHDSRRREAEGYLKALIELGPLEKGKRQTWFDAWSEIPLKRGGGIAVRESICNCAASILKRPPLLEDLEEDFIQVLLKRLRRDHPGTEKSLFNYMNLRLDELKRLAAHCSSKYKLTPIDWSGMIVARRYEIEHEINAGEAASAARSSGGGVLDRPISIDAKFSKVTLLEVVEKYIGEKLVGKSQNSTRLLRLAERKFSIYLTRPALLQDLNSDTVGRYLSYLLESNISRSKGKLSRRSVLCNQERLNSLWRYAASKGWLKTQPDLPLVTIPERIPDAWSPDEMEAILAAADAIPGYMLGPMAKVPKALYWKALIYFLYDTAERIGGVMEVTFADVSGEWVTVRAEGRKGKTRDKRFKLRPCTLEAIKQLRKLTDPKEVEKVFHWPQSRTYLWNKFKEVLERSGLPDSRRNKFHKFRRTAASEFEAAGGDATKLLDHRNRATTAKYIDPRVVGEVMPADIVPAIGEQRRPKAEPGEPVGPLSNDDLLAKMRALLEGGK